MGRELEVLLVYVLPMVVAEGAKKQAATKVLRGGLSIAKPMVEADGVSILGAQRVLKVEQIIALLTVVVGDVVTRVVAEQQEADQVCALGMEVARDAKKRTVQKVQKDFQAFVSPMVGVVVVNLQNAPREHKGALCFARHMVEARDVQ